MAQKNIVLKLPTPHMTAEAAGKIDEIKKTNGSYSSSLESALTDNGWRYIANDLKRLLHDIQEEAAKEAVSGSGEASAADDPSKRDETIEEEIDKLFTDILDIAEVEGEKAQADLKDSLYRALVWDPKSQRFSYNAPEVAGTSGLIKESIDQAFFDKPSDLTDTGKGSKYRFYKRHLFGSEPSEESREIILQFAYLMKMTYEETHTYLTKWSFSDGIRWDSPWELAAAYEIAHCPSRSEDRASSFLENIQNRIKLNREEPDARENASYLEFLREKEQQEYCNWADSFLSHRNRNLEDAFLCHWAWLLLASRAPVPESKIIPRLSREALSSGLPALYRSLRKFAEAHICPEDDDPYGLTHTLTAEDRSLQQEIICVMKNRQLRLAAAAYVYARVNITSADYAVNLSWQDHTAVYVPPRRNLGFADLTDYAHKIEDRFKEVKSVKSKPSAKPLRRPSRSDILNLGIELALTREGIEQLLSIGGFYPMLYSRDFFEFSLLQVLYKLEPALTHDGFRFAAKDSTQIRDDYACRTVCLEVKKQFLLSLEKNYKKLSPKNQAICLKSEPNWIKIGIRQEEIL